MALSVKPIEIVLRGDHQLLTKAEHWERVNLVEIASVQNGFAFKSEFFTHSEGKPLIRIRDIDRVETENNYSGAYENEYLVNKGDILVGMDGDFSASRWKGEQGLLNQRVCRIVVTTRLFSEKFLFLCLQPYLNAINSETSSITVKHLSSRTVEEIPLPLPPLDEQHRIVAKIEELFSELDKGIESLKTAREQLKVYRQALLKHAFEGKLTAQWREDNKDKLETAETLLKRIQTERTQRHQQQLADWQQAVKAWEANGEKNKKPSKPIEPKELSRATDEGRTELSQLPNGWVWEKLGWMTCYVEYGTSAKSSDTGTHPVLRMGNIQNAQFDWDDLVYTSDRDEIEKYLLKSGDVLFNRTNSPEWVGKTALYKGERPAVFAGYLIRVNHIESIVHGQYLNLFLNSRVAKQHGSKVKTDGVNQSNINGVKLINYPFPFCSLAEQEVIVKLLDERLSVIEKSEREIEENLLRSESLRQSILKKAFSGKLVPQDQTDEPASILFERIRTKKAAQVNAAKATKAEFKPDTSRKRVNA